MSVTCLYENVLGDRTKTGFSSGYERGECCTPRIRPKRSSKTMKVLWNTSHVPGSPSDQYKTSCGLSLTSFLYSTPSVPFVSASLPEKISSEENDCFSTKNVDTTLYEKTGYQTSTRSTKLEGKQQRSYGCERPRRRSREKQ